MTRVSAKPNRGPWILIGVLGCLALCLLMILAGGGAYLLLGMNQATPVARNIVTPTLSLPKSLPPLATSSAVATQIPTPAPKTSSGKIAFVSERDGGGAIFVMNVDGTQQTRVSGDLRMCADPVWSPDGKSIVFTTSAPDRPGSDFFTPSIVVMNADGSQQTRLVGNVEMPRMPAWSPDGTRIAFVGGYGQLYVVNPDGSNQTLLSKQTRNIESPAWSSDGTHIAFKSLVNGTSEVCVINADGSQEKCVTNHASFKARRIAQQDDYPVWSPDSKRIAFASIRSSQLDFDIHVMNADGSQRVNLTNKPSFYGVPAWSPDGKRIVFASMREANNYEIYVMNVDGTDLKRITNNPGWDGNPVWSPDGSRIVFDSNVPGKLDQDIYVINADGTGLTRLTDNSAADKNPMWQPMNR
jgi:Tol biopolymer transport system component